MNANRKGRSGGAAGAAAAAAAAAGPRGAPRPAVLAVLVLLVAVLGLHRSHALPIVDPGLFVILGVRTCGGGAGYCLLGTDCTLDRDFAADVEGGHCDGLRAAFTPAAHFSCCKYVERSNATLPGEPADTTTTEDPGQAATTVQASDDAENVIETEVRVKPAGDADKESANEDAVEESVRVDAVKEDAVEEDAKEPAEVASAAADGSELDKDAEKDEENDTRQAVKESDKAAGELNTVVVTTPSTTTLRVPLGPASGQTVTAVSEEYKVAGAPDEEEEEAEVVAVADVEKEAFLVSPSCRSPGPDVNPCWRSSFQDRQGATLCSGTLVGVDAAVTTAVCANRLLEAGMGAVALRVDGVSMPVRDVAVHPNYTAAPDDAHDVAVVRLFLPAGPPPGLVPGFPLGLGVEGAASAAPSPSCIACLPGGDVTGALAAGKTCYALAARLNGLGVETSAVCAGRIASAQAVHMKLSGCEVANLKTSIAAGEVLAVRAREGAAMVCDGTLHGLASTPSGSYASLAQHARWLTKTLAAPRTTTFRA